MKSRIVTGTSFVLMIIFAFSVNGVAQEETPQNEFIEAGEVGEWIKNGTAFTVLNVQTEKEHIDFGHPPGSLNIPYFNVDDETGTWVDNPSFMKDVENAISKDKKVVVVCTVGYRAGMAATKMKEVGYKHVYVFRNGLRGVQRNREVAEFEFGWIASGLPYEKGPKTYADYELDAEVDIIEKQTVQRWFDNDVPFKVLDVRNPNELTRYGKPENSFNVRLYVQIERDGETQWEINPDFVESVSKVTGKDDRIIIICTRSVRAARAAVMLQDAGFTNVRVFKHGIQGRFDGVTVSDGWRSLGLPFIKAEKKKENQ